MINIRKKQWNLDYYCFVWLRMIRYMQNEKSKNEDIKKRDFTGNSRKIKIKCCHSLQNKRIKGRIFAAYLI